MSFLAPLFLLGLIGIAVPILLHRMNFSDPPSQPFSSVLLMKNSEQIAATEKKLRYLLLLAARILALFLLVLLFVQPALRSDSPLITGPDQQHNLIVLDQSLSMSVSDLWQQALDRAEQRIDAMEDDETAQIIGAGADIRLITEATADRSTLIQGLARLEPEYTSLDYGQVVAALDNLAAGNEIPTQIYFLTDAQASNMPVRFSDLIPRRAIGLELDRVQLQSQAFNWALAADYAENEVRANVVSYSSPARQMQVDLFIEGDLRGTETVNLPASGSAQAIFENLDLDIDESRLEVRIEPGDTDIFPADDRYFLTANSLESVDVLILAANPSLQDTLFMDTALTSIAAPEVSTNVVYGGAGVNYSLEDFDLVVAMDAAALSEAVSNSLRSYAERGGNILAIAGTTSQSSGSLGLTEHQLSGYSPTFGTTETQGILIQRRLHGSVSDFSGTLSAQLYNPSELELIEDDLLIASTSEGYPWLVEHSLGLGRILIVTHSLSPDATNLGIAPEFVPLLRSWIKYLGGSGELPDQYETGDQIQVGIDLEENRTAPVQQVFLPEGDPLLSLQQQRQIQAVRFETPGVYGLQTSRGEHLAAVNTATAESDLTPMAENLIAQWRDLGSPQERSAANSVATAENGDNSILKSFESWLLPLLLIIILVESVLGNAHLKVRRETIA